MGRTGRRPGNPDTRGHILKVALGHFTRHGFEQASIRGIAREADVDPALIHRYFGDKRRLLLAAVKMSFDPITVIEKVLEGGTEDLAWRIVDTWSRAWEELLGPKFFVLLRDVPGLLPLLLRYLNGLLEEVAGRTDFIPPGEINLRVAVVEAQIAGFGYARYVTGLPALADLSREEFVGLVAPFVHQAIFAELGGAALRPAHRKSSPSPF